MIDDKRRYSRIKDQQIKVIYKAVETSSRENKTSVLDLSFGGMRLPLREKARTGTILEINILLPEENEPLMGLVKVIWQAPQMRKSPEGINYYETGIEFMRLGFQNRKRLSKYINSQMTQPPQPAS